MRISSYKTSNVQYFIFSYLRKQKNMLRELLGCKKKYCRLNITGADAAQHLKLFFFVQSSISWISNEKNALHFFGALQQQVCQLFLISHLFFFPPSSFLLHKFRFQNSQNVCTRVVATEYSLLPCLTPSSLSLIRSVSRKPLCKTELLDYNTFSAKKTQTSRKRLNKAKKIFFAAAGDRTRVTRVTGGNTYHYTTTTLMLRHLPRKFFTFYSAFDESMFERVCMIYIYINLFFSFFSELAKMNRTKYVFASQWFFF